MIACGVAAAGPLHSATDAASLTAALRQSQELMRAGSVADARTLAQSTRAQADAALAAEPRSATLHYVAGVASLVVSDLPAAVRSLGRAVELEPSNVSARLALARAYAAQSGPAHAIDFLQASVRVLPQDVPLQLALAEMLSTTQRHAEAEQLLEALGAAQPDDPRVFNARLRIYVATHDVNKADAGFQRLLQNGQIEKIDYLLQMADLYLARGDTREAGRRLQEARRENESHPALGERFARYYKQLAAKAAEEGAPARAVIYWQRAVEYAPADFDALYALARAHAKDGEHQKALALYKSALESKPTDPRFYADFADTLWAVDRADVAVPMLERVAQEMRQRGDAAGLRIVEQAQEALVQKAQALQRDPAAAGTTP